MLNAQEKRMNVTASPILISSTLKFLNACLYVKHSRTYGLDISEVISLYIFLLEFWNCLLLATLHESTTGSLYIQHLKNI